MGSDVRHVRGEAQKELVKKFEVFSSNGRSRWQLWSDWITVSAIAVSNATDQSHFDEREKQYLSIAGKYTRPEMEAFTEMLALLVVALGQPGTGLPWRVVYVLGAWKRPFGTILYAILHLRSHVRCDNPDRRIPAENRR